MVDGKVWLQCLSILHSPSKPTHSDTFSTLTLLARLLWDISIHPSSKPTNQPANHPSIYASIEPTIHSPHTAPTSSQWKGKQAPITQSHWLVASNLFLIWVQITVVGNLYFTGGIWWYVVGVGYAKKSYDHGGPPLSPPPPTHSQCNSFLLKKINIQEKCLTTKSLKNPKICLLSLWYLFKDDRRPLTTLGDVHHTTTPVDCIYANTLICSN